MFDRILVPLDGSRFSGQAVGYAIEIAKRFGSEAILMHVVTPATREPVVSVSRAASEIATDVAGLQDKRKLEHAKRYLREKLRQVTAQDVKGSTHVVLGTPAKSIIQFCEKENIELVVMTTRGKSGIKRAILGSVADEVIRESGLPVLAISPPKRVRK